MGTERASDSRKGRCALGVNSWASGRKMAQTCESAIPLTKSCSSLPWTTIATWVHRRNGRIAMESSPSLSLASVLTRACNRRTFGHSSSVGVLEFQWVFGGRK